MKPIERTVKIAAVLLGGSWVVISRVMSRVTVATIHIRRHIAPFITMKNPPSSQPIGTAESRCPRSQPQETVGSLRAKKGPPVQSLKQEDPGPRV